MTFRPDLYLGTALAYARHRPPYPVPLINHIIRTAVVSPPGKFLDLACGPGTLAIPLHRHFAESWAAFHRMSRNTVAARTHEWLRPGGWLALA